MSLHKMTSTEKKATCYLSFIMGLRMLGLFLVLPLFTLYALHLKNATPTLVGLAMGIYGLTQAFFQIPFGALSDRIGRKPILLLGLGFFITGSLIASVTTSISMMIVARALQGIGAIGSTALAMLADTTHESKRTKAMAIAGITIGLSFSLALVIGPLLAKWLPVSTLFLLAALFGLIALFLVYKLPSPPSSTEKKSLVFSFTAFSALLRDSELVKLNIGIFILHWLFTASFIALPLTLNSALHIPIQQQWHLYLPALTIAAVISLVLIGIMERKHQPRFYFFTSIFLLALSEFCFAIQIPHFMFISFSLVVFFTGFSLLEAFLPSLISRAAPTFQKGSALGIYSSAQFLGIFAGGLSGGWLYGHFNISSIYCFGFLLSLIWLKLAFSMQTLDLVSHHFALSKSQFERAELLLKACPGVREVIFNSQENCAYLKVSVKTLTHPHFIQLKNTLQSHSF